MTAFQPPVDLRPLTALRFGAAAWVALYTFWPNLDVGFIPNAVLKGYLGVELFFILSGFILCHVYLTQTASGPGEQRFSYKSFLWARIARVYPLHILTLVGVGVLGVGAVMAGMSIDSGVLSWGSLPAQLLMLHAWGLAPESGWNHASWSISAEWFAYLCFPAFAFVTWKLRDRPWLAVCGAVAFLLALYAAFEALAGFPLTEATFRWGALRIVPCFLLGCAFYLVHRRGSLQRPVIVALVSLAVITVCTSLLVWDALTVIACGGLILALGSLANARAGWLASGPAVWLGEISYAVYMVCVPWQLLAVNLAAKVTGAPDNRLHVFVWLVVLAGIPLVASVAHHLVERPARKALRGVADRRASRVKPGSEEQPVI